MPELPAGTDRSTLIVVRPKEVPEGTEATESVVGAAWLQAFPDDFEFVRFDGEEAAAEQSAPPAAPAKSERRPADAFN